MNYKIRVMENNNNIWQRKWVEIEDDAIADIGQGNKKLKKTRDALADMGIEDNTISAISSDIEAMQTLISQLNFTRQPGPCLPVVHSNRISATPARRTVCWFYWMRPTR